MATYKVKLKNRRQIAEGTMAFHFEKPSGFEFKAGQFVYLTLIDPPETDEEGNGRNYTVASAPYEEDLMIATRMRNTAFKRVLKGMALGAEIIFEGPNGSFVLHDNPARPAVFLAGGIGITPFRSIILQATRDKAPHFLSLFYSNRRPEDAAFLAELEEIEKVNPNYKFIGVMTKMEKSNRPWQGEAGYINKEMLAKFIDDLTSSTYYIAGPPAMVDALHNVLNAAGVNTDNIRAEEFTGY